MKRIFLLSLFSVFFTFSPIWSQCNINDATDCKCLDNNETDCYLLPNIGVSYDCLANIDGEINHLETPGKFQLSVSTPNTGHGPLRVIASDYYVCGTDTILSPGGFTGTCADGTYPHQLIWQRIYHKSGTDMSYTDRWAGSMTYHPTHDHMHIDDWGVYSLRDSVPGLPPEQWPILADGAKLGFCLMDYGDTNVYPTHFRDENGEIITQDQIDNYGLGGGAFECGMTNQGISVGFTDIYYYYLDGMFVNLPEGFCNGEYWLVAIVDPHNFFLEEDETNNVGVAKVTLTQQSGLAADAQKITVTGGTHICRGDFTTLSAYPNALSYEWSDGSTSPDIDVTESGTYYVMMESACGLVQSEEITINVTEEVAAPEFTSEEGDLTICVNEPINVIPSTALGENDVLNWYSTLISSTPLTTGPTLELDGLSATTTFYADITHTTPSEPTFSEPHDDQIGNSAVNGAQFNGELFFNVNSPFTLKSVKVFAIDSANANPRTIQVVDAADVILGEITAVIPDGESRVELNFDLLPGQGYKLRATENPRMKRNDENVTYPYTLGNNAGIIYDTNYGLDYYYYFYDWEIKEPDLVCTTQRFPVTIEVDLCSGMSNMSPAKITVYPNPATGMISLSHTGKIQNGKVEIQDISGRIVKQFFTGDNHPVLDIKDLSAGLYVLIWSDENTSAVTKFVKK